MRSIASGSHDAGHSGADALSQCSCSALVSTAPAATARETPSAPAPGLPVAGGRATASHATRRLSMPALNAAASLAPSYASVPRHTTPPAGRLAATEQMPEYTGAATTTGAGFFQMALARMELTPDDADGFGAGGVAAGETLAGGGCAAAAFGSGSGHSAAFGALAAAPRGLGSRRFTPGGGRAGATTGSAQRSQNQEPSGTAGSGGVRQ